VVTNVTAGRIDGGDAFVIDLADHVPRWTADLRGSLAPYTIPGLRGVDICKLACSVSAFHVGQEEISFPFRRGTGVVELCSAETLRQVFEPYPFMVWFFCRIRVRMVFCMSWTGFFSSFR
jgi:hypothetical protein